MGIVRLVAALAVLAMGLWGPPALAQLVEHPDVAVARRFLELVYPDVQSAIGLALVLDRSYCAAWEILHQDTQSQLAPERWVMFGRRLVAGQWSRLSIGLTLYAPGQVLFSVVLRNVITGATEARSGILLVRDGRVVLDQQTVGAIRSQALGGVAVRPMCGAQPAAPSQAPSQPPVDR